MAGRPLQKPNGVTRDQVLEMLKREADMDGVVVVSMAEIGRNLGITQTTIFKHINELIRRGELVKDEDATFNHQLKQYTIVNF